MYLNKCDASTSTDDVQGGNEDRGPPLCLYYFTHPFGVVSPEPPTVTTAPPPGHIARTFINMNPLSPFTFWTSSTEDSYKTTDSTRSPYEVGKTVRNDTVSTTAVSHSVFSSDIWSESSSSYNTTECIARKRVIPYNRILPPLQLHLPNNLSGIGIADDIWPSKCFNQGKFSLPPIHLSTLSALSHRAGDEAVVDYSTPRESDKLRQGLGLQKHRSRKRKRRRSDVRRMVTSLLRRNISVADTESVASVTSPAGAVSRALCRVLSTVRDAWPEPCSLFYSHPRSLSRRSCNRPLDVCKSKRAGACADMLQRGAVAGELPLRSDVSPGLLRRRYSVPETIMRKYRVAQQRVECEESDTVSRSRGSGGSLSARAVPRFTRDRELMRKSALLRRLWGRTPSCCRCCHDEFAARHSRSLDGSHSELRPELRRSPANLSASTYRSHAHNELTSATADTMLFSADECTVQSGFIELDAVQDPTNCGTVPDRTEENGSENRLSLTAKTTSSCETLEIVLTETTEGRLRPRQVLEQRTMPVGTTSSVSIDDYVSNVLVESLNSLTDRLELVTSRVPGDGKVSVVEKEIKVKLQSTGVNTIVHLSPTSNNQIIFGNAELLNVSEDKYIGFCETPCIRDDPHGVESDDASGPERSRSEAAPSETVEFHEDSNQAVLRQIQKLFQEELHDLQNSDINYSPTERPTISHIEISNISNVDVFLNNDTESHLPLVVSQVDFDLVPHPDMQMLSGVGACNYLESTKNNAVVPRFTALPYTASMEVNTSSDEAEFVGSECASLVDSLDDPNSPRCVLLRRGNLGRRTELVRSAIDVLDLLPETTLSDENVCSKEKSESFFVRIEDDDCDCEKENVNVADRMPEKIKQRLFRRHRRRQLRMESARRGRVKELRRELNKQRLIDEEKRKRDVERDCVAIIEALIDDVISKIAQDELKCARIKRRSDVVTTTKCLEKPSKRNKKKQKISVSETSIDPTPAQTLAGSIQHVSTNDENDDQMHQVRGKLSLLRRPIMSTDERRPRRLYQKSEIREGTKCIEILEILEYLNSDRSSPDTPGSDDSPGCSAKTVKKSRIPIPVQEKTQRQIRNLPKPVSSGEAASPLLLHNVPAELYCQRRGSESDARQQLCSPSVRRVSLPSAVDARPRPGSVRFRRVFDVIPEERSSLSIESSNDDADRGLYTVTTGPGPPPATRSVATSPLACSTAEPLRVKSGEAGGIRAQVRHPSVSTPVLASASRGEGTREKIDSVGVQATRRSTLCQSRSTDKKVKLSHKQGTEVKSEKKPNRVKSDLRQTRPSVPAPSPGESTRGNISPVEHDCRSEEEHNEVHGEEWSSSGESVLCPLAPRWLTAAGRPARRRRRAPSPRPRPRKPAPSSDPGEWSVTVAGSCRAALPADVEMRLRFPRCGRRSPRRSSRRGSSCAAASCQECRCSQRQDYGHCVLQERNTSPPSCCAVPPLPSGQLRHPALTVTLKKEARDSSILASKSTKKSKDPLPDLETYSSSRSKFKSSMKMRRGCSLDCWLPDDERTPIRASEMLSVCGSAIIPEVKPRVPTMSERDLTRLYTPRHYLRS